MEKEHRRRCLKGPSPSDLEVVAEQVAWGHCRKPGPQEVRQLRMWPADSWLTQLNSPKCPEPTGTELCVGQFVPMLTGHPAGISGNLPLLPL